MLGLKKLFNCRLCWQITSVIFVGILTVEALILIPSYANHKSNLIHYASETGRLQFTNLLYRYGAGPKIHEQLNLLIHSNNQATPNINNAVLQTLETYSLFDSSGKLVDQWQSPSPLSTPSKRLALEWELPIADTPYYAKITINNETISKELSAYALRISGLVLVISLFTTLVTILTLQRRILSPIMVMQSQMQPGSSNISISHKIKNRLHEDNELGDLFKSFSQLINNQASLLASLESKKNELNKLNLNLALDVEKRTEDLTKKNSQLLISIKQQQLAQQKIESIALFPKENANPVLRFAEDGKLLYANPASEYLLTLWQIKTGEMLPGRWGRIFKQILKKERSRKIILKMDKRFLKMMMVPISEKEYANIYVEDITQEKINEQRAKHLAFYEAVTGLPNRTQFFDWLDDLEKSVDSLTCQYVVLTLDLTNYTVINKTFGYQVSERLLKYIKNITQKELHRLTKSNIEGEQYEVSVCLAHTGTHEFAMLLRRSDQGKGLQLANSIASALEKPVSVLGQSISLNLTIGIAAHPVHGTTSFEVYHNAILAMRDSTDDGKQSVHCFSEALGKILHRKMQLLNDLKFAIERNELHVYFQPKVETKKRIISGSEALLRWVHPELGMISPTEFIPIAEENDLIQSIGAWVMEQAITDHYKWQLANNSSLKIAINLSAQQFQDEQLVERISELINRIGIAPSTVEFELTETMLMETGEKTIETLHRLKSLGVQLAIDDFGTGYSSLAYLSRFPIDTLKIDRTFIINLVTSHQDQTIAKAIIYIAKSLDLTVVAEGVETEEQLKLLKKWGCDLIQGYYFSKPLNATMFSALLKDFNEVA